VSTAIVEQLEGGLVERAVLFPACCEVCLGTQGPFWDSGVDRPIGPAGRGGDCHVYLCRNCLRLANLATGYAKGERMAELDEAADRLVEAEAERDEAAAAAHKMANELTRIQQERIALTQQVERLREQNEQLLFRAQQVATAANQLIVGASD
jgi:hypothetical protein